MPLMVRLSARARCMQPYPRVYNTEYIDGVCSNDLSMIRSITS